MDTVGRDQRVAACRHRPVRAVHQAQRRGDAMVVLREMPELMRRMDVVVPDPGPYRLAEHAEQVPAADGELREVIARFEPARFAPDLLAEPVGVGQLTGAHRDAVERVQQAESGQLLDRMGRTLMPTPSSRIVVDCSNTSHSTPTAWRLSAVANPPMPPAISTFMICLLPSRLGTVGGVDTRAPTGPLQPPVGRRSAPGGPLAGPAGRVRGRGPDRRSTRPARLWNDGGIGQSAIGWTAMEFLILGPLEVRSDDGQPVRVRASKQRILLAMLLVHANATVTDQALVDALWETEPPPSAIANLRTYASAVRRLLSAGSAGAAAGARLLTQAGGYRLQVDPERLDLLRWRRLVDRGTAAYRRGDLAGAAEELAEASALWRGRPLGDLELHGAVHAQVAALNEQCLEALEALVGARLGLGEHAELAVELRRLVEEQPFHERFWELLMLALYRSGRQAEALAAYQEARQLLIGELGVEPGPALQRLERAILSADPALRPSPGEAAGATARAPGQLPPDVAGFTGREDLLAVLGRHLVPAGGAGGGAGDGAGRGTGTVVAAIAGTAGVGKTALAVHAAHLAAGHFPDGQLYANLHGASAGLQPLQPLDVLGRFLRALGIDPSAVPAELEEASAMFRSQVTDRRLLVVLDNAADAAQV